MQMDCSRSEDMFSSDHLFVACRKLRQWRFLPWTKSGTGIARFNNWLVETRRMTYVRGFLSDFQNLELVNLNNRAARLTFPSPPKEWNKVETVWGMYGIPRSPAITYVGDMIVPRNEGVAERDRCCRHHLWRVILSDHVDLVMKAWMHYRYCPGRMFRLSDDLRACIAKLDVSGLGLIFGNRQDAADCVVHLAMHDQIPFDKYPPTWRKAAPWTGQSVFPGPMN